MKKCIFIRFFGCIVALCVFVATFVIQGEGRGHLTQALA